MCSGSLVNALNKHTHSNNTTTSYPLSIHGPIVTFASGCTCWTAIAITWAVECLIFSKSSQFSFEGRSISKILSSTESALLLVLLVFSAVAYRRHVRTCCRCRMDVVDVAVGEACTWSTEELGHGLARGNRKALILRQRKIIVVRKILVVFICSPPSNLPVYKLWWRVFPAQTGKNFFLRFAYSSQHWVVTLPIPYPYIQLSTYSAHCSLHTNTLLCTHHLHT